MAFKYVFNTRGDPVRGVVVDYWMDVTTLAECKSKEGFERYKETLARLGESTVAIDSQARALTHLGGQTGDIMRRMHPEQTPPMLITWEGDDPLAPEDMEKYLNALSPKERDSFYKKARF